MMHIGHIGMMVENINSKLLIIKIIERSKLIKGKAYLWYYQISNGIKETLKFTHTGIKKFQEMKKKKIFEQLYFEL